MTFTTALLISTLVLSLAPLSQGWAKDLGTFGAVYPIAEPDSLAELKEKAAKVDWKRHLDREKLTRKVRNYKPSDLKRLPATARDRAFLSDLSYTLDVDIPDGKGGILYPKGYTFNPLDYIQMRRTIVVIDGKRPQAGGVVSQISLVQGRKHHASPYGWRLFFFGRQTAATGLLRERADSGEARTQGGPFGGTAEGTLHGGA